MSRCAGALAALTTLIDPVWCAKRLPEGRSSMPLVVETLARCAPNVVRSAINPLVDLKFIRDRYLSSATGLTALEVAVSYATEFLPIGRSPHPLIDRNLFRICNPAVTQLEKSGAIRSWADVLFSAPNGYDPILLPFLDPAFVLQEMGLNSEDLSALGVTSASRLYLGEAAFKGIRPNPLFDPIYVHAKRTGNLPSMRALKDPGGFLTAELGLYIQQAGQQGRASPSIGFDEDLLRANRHVAGALRRRLYANAFHAWMANSGRMAGRPLTTSGIDAFPSCITPPNWWILEKGFSLPRRRSSAGIDAAFVKAAGQRLSKQKPPPVHARIEGDLPQAIRLGQWLSLIIHGCAISPHGCLTGVEIKVGAQRAARSFQGAPRPHAVSVMSAICKSVDRLFCNFAIDWHGIVKSVGPLPVAVRFRHAGAGRNRLSSWVAAGTITVEAPMVRTRSGRPAQVAIAMATYNPNPELFRAQIESIRAQTLTDWRMVISDESPEEAVRKSIRQIVAGDSRISFESGPRLGFVGNFERALSRLDRRSPYFALSDQDDVWYPTKLDTLTAALNDADAALVYGGMRIVSDAGATIDDSFFSWRRRHADTTEELLIANTVTGAACLGKTDLLPLALPIPRFPGVFHDMWIALVASRSGRIGFVDTIVQDYVQHRGNVLGQSSRDDRAFAARLAREIDELRHATEALNGGLHVLSTSDRARRIGRALAILAHLWPELVQREFLWLALANRLNERRITPRMGRRPWTTAQRETSNRATRSFMNIPAWLASGSALLAGLRKRPKDDHAIEEALAHIPRLPEPVQ